MKRNFSLLLILLVGAWVNNAHAASQTGTITGKVKVWRTKVKTKGAKSSKDVIVYLEKVDNNNFAPSNKHVQINQKGLVFVPHVLAIEKGTRVSFQNSDHDNHNVYLFNDKTGKISDLGTRGPGTKIEHQFNKPGSVTILCKIHLEMAAHLLILGNPYFTHIELDGDTQDASFTLKDVPQGSYVINAWHKKLKLKGGGKKITVQKGKTVELELTVTKKKYANL